MKYGKKQRNRIYRKALEIATSTGGSIFICLKLNMASGYYANNHKETYPEFALITPKKWMPSYAFTWGNRVTYGKKYREWKETILCLMIALTD